MEQKQNSINLAKDDDDGMTNIVTR